MQPDPSLRRGRSELKAEPHQNKDSWEAALLPGFLCFILDTSWVKSREITIEILCFPSSEKTFLCLHALPLMFIHPSYHITESLLRGRSGGVATDKGGRRNST